MRKLDEVIFTVTPKELALLTYGVPAGEAMKLYFCTTLLATHI